MTIAGLSPLPPPGDSRHGSRRSHRRTVWIASCLVALTVLVALGLGGIYALDSFRHGVAQGIGDFVGKTAVVGGTASSEAVQAAASQGVPPSHLTPAVLNDQVPAYLWVSGTTNVPYSAGKRVPMGVSVGVGQVLTAFRFLPGTCSYGLTVTSVTDPLISADHLPGVGTYFQAPVTKSKCVANEGSSPSTSWLPVNSR